MNSIEEYIAKSNTLKTVIGYVMESMIGELRKHFEHLKPLVKSIINNINKVEPSDTEVEEYFRNQIFKNIEELLSLNEDSDEEV